MRRIIIHKIVLLQKISLYFHVLRIAFNTLRFPIEKTGALAGCHRGLFLASFQDDRTGVGGSGGEAERGEVHQPELMPYRKLS
jgi:hypothetical protein